MLNIHTKDNLFVESMHLVGLLCVSVEIDFDSGFGTGGTIMYVLSLDRLPKTKIVHILIS